MRDTAVLTPATASGDLTCVCCSCLRERVEHPEGDEWRQHIPRPGEQLTYGICVVCLYALYPELAPFVRDR